MSSYVKMVFSLSLVFLAAIGWHFGTVLGWFGSPPATQAAFFWRIGIILVGFLVLSVGCAAFLGKRDKVSPLPDEREEKIDMLAERNGVLAIYAGLLVLMWFVFTPLEPMQVANGILVVVCFTEIVKLVSALFYLKRGV